MKIHYAVYDPSFYGPFGNYWSWKSEAIPKDLMESIYYMYFIKNKPEYPNNLTAQDLWGGALALEDWLVLYRYYDGGRDVQGRPGRYVILTGWIARGDCDASILRALQTSTFDALAKAMPLPCPVEQPTALEETLEGDALELPEKSELLEQLEQEPTYDYAGFDVDGALRDILTLAKLDPAETFHLELRQQGSETAIQMINCRTKPEPKPEPKPKTKTKPKPESDSEAAPDSSSPSKTWQYERRSAKVLCYAVATNSCYVATDDRELINANRSKWLFRTAAILFLILISVLVFGLISGPKSRPKPKPEPPKPVSVEPKAGIEVENGGDVNTDREAEKVPETEPQSEPGTPTPEEAAPSALEPQSEPGTPAPELESPSVPESPSEQRVPVSSEAPELPAESSSALPSEF